MADKFFPFLTSLEEDFAPSSCAYLPDVDARPPDKKGSFVLEQNYPNPFRYETTVPFTLVSPADVHLNLFDALGRKVAGVVRKGRGPGKQSIKLNLYGLNLPAGDYVYQLQVSSRQGVFHQSLVMTTQ